MSEKNNNVKDIIFFIKLSIIQFLLKKNFSFYVKDKEIIFDLVSDNKKTWVQNSIIISDEGILGVKSCFCVATNFLEKELLIKISNYINEFSGVFNSYVTNADTKRYNLFWIKSVLHPAEGTCLDDDFWNNVLKIQVHNISTIIDFIYYNLPNSNFFNSKDFDSLKFKDYLYTCIKTYIEAINLIEYCKNELDFKNWSKEKIEKEIDKELDLFSKGEQNTEKLDSLVNALKDKDKL